MSATIASRSFERAASFKAICRGALYTIELSRRALLSSQGIPVWECNAATRAGGLRERDCFTARAYHAGLAVKDERCALAAETAVYDP